MIEVFLKLLLYMNVNQKIMLYNLIIIIYKSVNYFTYIK